MICHDSGGEITLASKVCLDCAGQSRGFGFVHMDNGESASNAAAGMNGKPMDGRPLVVRLRSEGPDKRGGGGFDRPRGGGFGPMENDESKVRSSPALACLSGARHVCGCRCMQVGMHARMQANAMQAKTRLALPS